MATSCPSFDCLSDQDLLREVVRLAAGERETTACLVASLAVLDRRRLYLAEGYGSLFVYCTEVLRLSESATYKRIAAARAAQRFPVILERLAAGDVTLTTIRLLAPHLTEANHVAVLNKVRHCSTREVEQVVARLQPRPDVPSKVRKLPTPPATTPAAPAAHAPVMSAQTESPPAPASARDEALPSCGPAIDTGPVETRPEPVRAPPSNAPRGTVMPLAPARYKVSFTISAETYAKLREVQDLFRHVIPGGDVAALFARWLTLLLREAAKTKHAATEQPRVHRPSSLRQAQGPKPSRRATTLKAPFGERSASPDHTATPGGRLAGGAAATRPTARSRHIPAEVKRRVWARDGGQCAFVSMSGQRCTQRGFLEYHHRVPYAAGGEASVDNISLRCRAHNAHEAEHAFGPWQPTLVREQRPRYGGDVVAASERPLRARVCDAFVGRDAARSHAGQWPGRSATGRAASSWRLHAHRAPAWPCYLVPPCGRPDLVCTVPNRHRGEAFLMHSGRKPTGWGRSQHPQVATRSGVGARHERRQAPP